jgi:hypothetical protein
LLDLASAWEDVHWDSYVRVKTGGATMPDSSVDGQHRAGIESPAMVQNKFLAHISLVERIIW